MIARFVGFCLHRRVLMLAIFLSFSVLGFYALRQLNIDAYPDIGDVTAQVITQYPGHAAEEVEQQITIPLERELNGITGLHVMRSQSTFGLSLIMLVFEDGTEDYFQRQRILERISGVPLPPGVQAGLDAPTSPIGEIYRYTVQSHLRSPRELRDLNNWVVMPRLKQVPGVIDVNPFGGENYQFQVLVDPTKADTIQPVARASGGGHFGKQRRQLGWQFDSCVAKQGFVVRGLGAITKVEDLDNIVVTQKNGAAIFLKDLGHAEMGVLPRQGILGLDNNDDAVSGITLLLLGANPLKAAWTAFTGRLRK